MDTNTKSSSSNYKQNFFEIVSESLIENYYIAIEVDMEKQKMEICNLAKNKFLFDDVLSISKPYEMSEIGRYIIKYLTQSVTYELMPGYLEKTIKNLESTDLSNLKALYKGKQIQLGLIKNLERAFNDYKKAKNKLVKSRKETIDNQNNNGKKVNEAFANNYYITNQVYKQLSALAVKDKIKNNLNIKNLDFEIHSELLVIKNTKKVEIKIVGNIPDFLVSNTDYRNKYFFAAETLNLPNQIYYRGNKINFDLSTSLYREDSKIDGLGNPQLEHIINNRIIQNMPNDFDNCDSLFEKLTILKHFNCPSRLLDITKNPLIAAFFALDNYNNKTPAKFGQIHCCFPKNYSIIKNSKNSDSVSLLSALCTTDKNNIESFESIIKQIAKLKNFILDLNIAEAGFEKSWNFSAEETCMAIIKDLKKESKILIEKFIHFYDLKWTPLQGQN